MEMVIKDWNPTFVIVVMILSLSTRESSGLYTIREGAGGTGEVGVCLELKDYVCLMFVLWW